MGWGAEAIDAMGWDGRGVWLGIATAFYVGGLCVALGRGWVDIWGVEMYEYVYNAPRTREVQSPQGDEEIEYYGIHFHGLSVYRSATDRQCFVSRHGRKKSGTSALGPNGAWRGADKQLSLTRRKAEG